MQIISLIQGLWVALIILMFFVKLRTGICLYVAYMILVPYMNINLGINLQWNMVNTLLLVAFFFSCYKGKKAPISFKPFWPFLFLYVAQLMEMPFQHDVPFDYSFNSFRLNLMSYMILPFVIWNHAATDPELSGQLRKTVLICICIAFGYGLFLTTTDGQNPYQMLIMAANGEEWNAGYAKVGGGRMFGRISSVFGHPMTYGLFLGMALVYVYSVRECLNKYVGVVLILGIIAAIFLCGIRSPIGALFATVLVFLLLNHKVKLMIQVAIVGCLGYAIISSVPDLNSYVESIFSDDKSEVAGSSIEMRMEQFEGCLAEIRNNPIFGKGYDWVGYYKTNFGDHPVMLAFESLSYVVLCNSGFLGVVIWVVFLIRLYQSMKRNVKNKETLIMVLVLMAFYLAYSMITGEYGYMKYFMLFYTFILLEDNEVRHVITSKKLKY